MIRRLAASTLVIAVAMAALRWLCLIPYQVNVRLKTLERATTRIYDSPDRYRLASVARANVDELQFLLREMPGNIDLLMLLAANQHLLGNEQESARIYENLLAIDRRPEIYLNLGLAQEKLGNHAAAVESLVTAVRFQPEMIEEIGDPLLGAVVTRRIAALPER